MNAETKRHIDAARQVLVGVVPNPTSQIDQITNALIYKFMDDMDQSAIKSGGEASFFTGDLERYAWTRLMDTRVGNQERMNLYSEALVKFSESKQLPELFRNIFKSAYLPYRSPDVLGLFLKEIDYFNYSHPEELGNAYEYLLSIMSSQGDAGQFRTPRHIIDFIVEAVNPTKDDKVLDPACGTGGFLISAYKNILKHHDGKDDPKKKERPLTPDQRRTLMQNFEGYDIDPGMVRIAQVNMYLHQFKNPKIVQYDSLSMDERWNDKFDVILANPPFMSPKGGVSTHNKFGIQSTRSEVLFVDYIMNHLRPKGRAGIIVPEGIIFQSGTAYKQLRKSLVEDGLYAVVSLPSGVFQPYSGVKTSILFFDNEISKKANNVLFVKISNDGFELGAQRRPLNTSHLPAALEILHLYRQHVLEGKKIIFKSDDDFALLVSKEKITETSDYNLSGDRYRISTEYVNTKWPIVKIGDVAKLMTGGTPLTSKNEYYGGNIKWLVSGDINKGEIFDCEGRITELALRESNAKLLPANSVLIALNGQGKTRGTVAILRTEAACNQSLVAIDSDRTKLMPEFLLYVLKGKYQEIRDINGDNQRGGLNMPIIRAIKIPLPPLEIQKEIVEQIEVKQKAIEGAKEVIKNLERERRYFTQSLRAVNNVTWVKLVDICKLEYGYTDQAKEKGDARFVRITDISDSGRLKKDEMKFIELNKEAKNFLLGKGDVLVARTGATFGKTVVFNESYPAVFASYLIKLTFDQDKIIPDYYWLFTQSEEYWKQAEGLMTGGGQPQFNANAIKKLKVPIIPIDLQKQFVEDMKDEEEIIESNKKLIQIMEKKMTDVLSGI